MKSPAFEALVLNVLERVKKGQPIEDSRVELKTTWPEPPKAARRIAGHANALRGEAVIWIVGVDEKAHLVPGAPPQEVADWISRVQSRFDGISPRLELNLNIPFEGTVVTALLFDCERVPFLVKNKDGGEIQFEVPWREGTAVRTAKRQDLLLLLTPIVKQPRIEVLRAQLRGDAKQPRDVSWTLTLWTYCEPYGEEPMTIPYHRCRMEAEVEGILARTAFPNMFVSLDGTTPTGPQAAQKTVIGPNRIIFEGRLTTKKPWEFSSLSLSPASVWIQIAFAGQDRSIPITLQLTRNRTPGLDFTFIPSAIAGASD